MESLTVQDQDHVDLAEVPEQWGMGETPMGSLWMLKWLMVFSDLKPKPPKKYVSHVIWEVVFPKRGLVFEK